MKKVVLKTISARPWQNLTQPSVESVQKAFDAGEALPKLAFLKYVDYEWAFHTAMYNHNWKGTHAVQMSLRGNTELL